MQLISIQNNFHPYPLECTHEGGPLEESWRGEAYAAASARDDCNFSFKPFHDFWSCW